MKPMTLLRLRSLQCISGDPYKSRPETRQPYYEVVQSDKVLLVKYLDYRCEQEIAAFWNPGIVGTWKTLGVILIQPAVMKPKAVAMCDALYNLAVELPGDVSIPALRVFWRGDAYAGPAPKFAELPAMAIPHY